MPHSASPPSTEHLRRHGSRLIVIGGFLTALALAILLGSWIIMWNVSAEGTATGFLTALKASYDAHRPIPDGQYVTGRFRVMVTHTTQGAQSDLQVDVLENHTGLHLATATRSADAN
ncbi:MAG: hypothetical protein KGR26_09330 [Cyanobacteria bacterium REEB65]|nr:hypothetical protein [Cyanobacteria bacterium REEB65]